MREKKIPKPFSNLKLKAHEKETSSHGHCGWRRKYGRRRRRGGNGEDRIVRREGEGVIGWRRISCGGDHAALGDPTAYSLQTKRIRLAILSPTSTRRLRSFSLHSPVPFFPGIPSLFLLLLLSLAAVSGPLFLNIWFIQLQSTPGVTGAVMWDSGVVLAKFLEHAVDSGMLLLQGKKVIELGSGCGLVG